MENEVCICAAIRDSTGTIWRGNTHADAIREAIMAGAKMAFDDPDYQGFVTSRGNFVNRHEGYLLQVAAGIESKQGSYMGEHLYSEDL